jgi:hypothetical protein
MFRGSVRRYPGRTDFRERKLRPANWVVVLAQIHKKQTSPLGRGNPKDAPADILEVVPSICLRSTREKQSLSLSCQF